MTSPTMNIFKLLALFVMIATASLSQAQESKAPADGTKHRVVFEVTMEGPEQWTAVLNNVENLRTALGAATAIESSRIAKASACWSRKTTGSPTE